MDGFYQEQQKEKVIELDLLLVFLTKLLDSVYHMTLVYRLGLIL